MDTFTKLHTGIILILMAILWFVFIRMNPLALIIGALIGLTGLFIIIYTVIKGK